MKFNIYGDTYLISGAVLKSNFKSVQKGDKTYHFSDASVVVDDTLDKSDPNKYVKLVGRFQTAKLLKNLDKGDNVFAIARFEEREYEGKKYQEYAVDYVSKAHGQSGVTNSHIEPMKPVDDEDLPF